MILESIPLECFRYFCPMRKSIPFHISNHSVFCSRLLEWGKKYERFIILDSNHQTVNEPNCLKYSNYSFVAGAGAISEFKKNENCFGQLDEFVSNTRDWLLGYLSYDLTEETENIKISRPERFEFEKMYFFQPEWLILILADRGEFLYPKHYGEDKAKREFSYLIDNECNLNFLHNSVLLHPRLTKEKYGIYVNDVKGHIARGDIYEVNYCFDFYSENAQIDPYAKFLKLNDYSPAPFASFVKHKNNFLLSSSPERFLKKETNKIISQPIKGTAPRDIDAVIDFQIKKVLSQSEKERSENIMITDLVRNDLSRTAIPGSVVVESLCEVYSFKHVHQLISTIVGNVQPDRQTGDILKNAFPMGSMTGAPKNSAVKIIEQSEQFRRELFSGSVGYFAPDGNFDFNVIIRSILYNADTNYVSVPVGSAITSLCDVEKEYEECLLKARAMLRILEED